MLNTSTLIAVPEGEWPSNPTTPGEEEKPPLIRPSPSLQRILRNHPTTVNCSVCRSLVTTQVDYVRGNFSWIICAVFFALGFVLIIPWFLCWLPFCLTDCQDTVHYCPNCKTRIGQYVRMTWTLFHDLKRIIYLFLFLRFWNGLMN